ncbi:hypothetical protein CIB48_g8018 [Xylaria polymorpha]|nr:hypothetical protein CIB48_g8018 [Xylaria polymorpha]
MDLASSSACIPSTFSTPILFGVGIVSLDASPVHNYSRYVSDQDYAGNPEVFVENANFCNVTVMYTHPGTAAFRPWEVAGNAQVPHTWVLLSPGNVNWHALQNLASTSLIEQGGRQGVQLAQRYPDAYDGIAAATPAIYWPQFFHAMLWPQLVMKTTAQYPHACELEFLQFAVINHCDGQDGILDGIIMDPETCKFDPFEFVDTSFYCNETRSTMQLSHGAAAVAAAYRAGARAPDGSQLWCKEDGTSCEGIPFPYEMFWVRYFAMKDPDWDFKTMTPQSFARTFRLATQEYTFIIYGTSDPNLSLFRDAGGKMITYHAL